MDYDVDYVAGGGDGQVMMSRVRDTLDHRVWTDSKDLASSARSLQELRSMFTDGAVENQRLRHQRHQDQVMEKHQRQFEQLPTPNRTVRVVKKVNEANIPAYHPSKRTGWQKPHCDAPAPADPGWMPHVLKNPSGAPSPTPYRVEGQQAAIYQGQDEDRHYAEQQQQQQQQQQPRQRQRVNSASRVPETNVRPAMTPFIENRRSQRQEAPAGHNYETEPMRHIDSGRPAWMGSLQPARGTKAWEVASGEAMVPGGVDQNEAKQQSAAQSSTYEKGQQREYVQAEAQARQPEQRQTVYSDTQQDPYASQPEEYGEYGNEYQQLPSSNETNILAEHSPHLPQESTNPTRQEMHSAFENYRSSQEHGDTTRYQPEEYQETRQQDQAQPEVQYQRRRPQDVDPYYPENQPYEEQAEMPVRKYNSPAGLYAGGAAPQQRRASPAGRRGSDRTGVVVSTSADGKKYFNPSESNVYQLLKEEDDMRRQRAQQQRGSPQQGGHQQRGPQQGRPQQGRPPQGRPQQGAHPPQHGQGQGMAYLGYGDPMQKSPTMLALERHVATDF